MARGKVGEAVIEAVSDTDRFERDLGQSIQDAVAEASRDSRWDPLVEASGRAGGRAGSEFTRRFTIDARGRLHDERGRFLSVFGSAFGRFGFDVGGDFLSRFLAGFAAAARHAPITGGLLSGLTQLVSVITTLGAPGLLGGLSAFSIIVGVLVVALPLLTSAIFALGGALVSLVGLVGALPGLFTGVLATLAPLIIAFQGFGEVIGALTSGDLDKFNEALKNLTPSARSVALEVRALMPFFTEMRKTVQEAFFSQASGGLTRFFGAAGPTLTGGLANIAFVLGKFTAALAAFGAQPATVAFLARLFDSVTSGLSTGGPVIVRFLEAIVAIADASLPVIEAFFGTLGQGVDRFSAFLKDAAASGEFAAFLERSFAILGAIGGVIAEITRLFFAMFGSEVTQESTVAFFEDIERLLAEMTAWFQSPDGQEFLENMAVLAEDFWEVLDTLVLPALRLLFQLFAGAIELADDLGDALDRLAGKTSIFGVGGSAALKTGLGTAAAGGITQGPVIAGEAGEEAILPLDDPVRARQIASDPAVQNVLGAGDGMTVIAIFDGEPFQARIVKVTRRQMQTASRQLTQKPRVGVR